MTQTLTIEPTLAELNQKIDRLTTQIEFLTEEALRQKRRQQAWDELKDDLLPIGNDIFRMSVEQLEEVQHCVKMEDMLRLLKRLLRNTCNLGQMLEQLESLMELWRDLAPLSRDAFLTAMNYLNDMEQKGYFVAAQGGLDLADRLVASFTAEEIRRLNDQIVPLVKELTQPQVITMLSQTVRAVAAPEPPDASILGLLRQLSDPAARRGLAKSLQILKAIGNS